MKEVGKCRSGQDRTDQIKQRRHGVEMRRHEDREKYEKRSDIRRDSRRLCKMR